MPIRSVYHVQSLQKSRLATTRILPQAFDSSAIQSIKYCSASGATFSHFSILLTNSSMGAVSAFTGNSSAPLWLYSTGYSTLYSLSILTALRARSLLVDHTTSFKSAVLNIIEALDLISISKYCVFSCRITARRRLVSSYSLGECTWVVSSEREGRVRRRSRLKVRTFLRQTAGPPLVFYYQMRLTLHGRGRSFEMAKMCKRNCCKSGVGWSNVLV